MATVKVSVEMQSQILKLYSEGISIRKIAKTLKLSRNTVKVVINQEREETNDQ